MGEAWAEYEKRCVNPQAGPVQRDETWKAFWCGGLSVLTLMMRGVSDSDEMTESDEALMLGLQKEFDEFSATLLARAADEGTAH